MWTRNPPSHPWQQIPKNRQIPPNPHSDTHSGRSSTCHRTNSTSRFLRCWESRSGKLENGLNANRVNPTIHRFYGIGAFSRQTPGFGGHRELPQTQQNSSANFSGKSSPDCLLYVLVSQTRTAQSRQSTDPPFPISGFPVSLNLNTRSSATPALSGGSMDCSGVVMFGASRPADSEMAILAVTICRPEV